MLDDYVYRTLKKYKNCVISMEDIKKYGKENIIKDLKKHGLKCDIRIVGKDIEVNNYNYFDRNTFNEANVIIEVI